MTILLLSTTAQVHNAIRLRTRLPQYKSEAILLRFTFVLFKTAFGSRVRFCRDLMLVLIQQMSSQRLKPQRLRHCTA